MGSLAMKFHLIVMGIFVTSAFAGVTIKEFEDEFHELWSDPNDEKAASEELAKEEASIEQHNLDFENGLSSYSEKLNELSAIPIDQFEAEKEGAIIKQDYATGLIETPEEERKTSPEDQAYLDSIYEEMDRQYVAPSYDARNDYLITKPKNQMSCGSCAAFAATATHETCMCKPTWNTGAKVTKAITDYGCNEDKLKKLVYKYGAVATGIYASDRGLSNVNKGVFDQCSTTKINHAVTVVGYGTWCQGSNCKDYWLIKNSWGDNWGDGGYVKIARGKGACGIGQNCALTECTRTGYASPAPKAPPPAPIPPNQICDISKLYGRNNITGDFKLSTKVNGKEYVADVTCKNSKCSPRIAGPSNACMYICGKIQC